MWSPAIDRQANAEAEDFFGGFGEAPPPPMARSPPQNERNAFDDVPLSAPAPEEERSLNTVSAAALGEASPEETAQQHAAPESSAPPRARDAPEATQPRHASILGRLWGPPSGSTDPEINAPPEVLFDVPPPEVFAAPPPETGEDLGWGVEDLGDDSDVWDAEPDTPHVENHRHLDVLTNYLLRHNPAKAANAPRLLQEFEGREEELFANVELKYGEKVLTPPSMGTRVMSATMSNMENAVPPSFPPATPAQKPDMGRRQLSAMENARFRTDSPPATWTPAPTVDSATEAESAEKLFGAHPEEHVVAEMFDAIVEEEAFAAQPPHRVATGELFGGAVAPLAAADAFSAARDAEAHRAESMAGIGAPEDQPAELQTEFTFAAAAEEPEAAAAAFGAPPSAAAFAPAPEELPAAAAFGAPPGDAAGAFDAPPGDAAGAFDVPAAFEAAPEDSAAAAFGTRPSDTATTAFGAPPTGSAADAFGAAPEEQAFGGPPTDAAAAFSAPEDQPAELQTEFTFAPAEEQPAAAMFGAPPDAAAAFPPAPEEQVAAFGAPPTEPSPAAMFGAPPTDASAQFGVPATAFGAAPEEQPAAFEAQPTTGLGFGAPPEEAFGAPPPDAASAFAPAVPEEQVAMFGAPPTFAPAPEEQPPAAMFGAPPSDAAAEFGAPPQQPPAFRAPPADASAAFGLPSAAAAFAPAPEEQPAAFGASAFGATPDAPPAAAAMIGGVPETFSTQSSPAVAAFGSPEAFGASAEASPMPPPPAAAAFGSPEAFGAAPFSAPAAAEASPMPPPPAPSVPPPSPLMPPPASTVLEVVVNKGAATARCGAVECTCVLNPPMASATGLPLLDSLVEALANAADATLSLRTTIGGEPQRAGVEYSTRAHDSALFSCAGSAIGAACREAFHELGQAEVVVVRGGAVVKATLEDASGAVVCDTAPYGRVPRGGRLRVGSYRTCLTPLFFEALGLHLGRGLRLTSQRTGDAMNCLEAAFAACGLLLRVARPGESVPCGPRTGTASARTASCFVDLDEADGASEVATGVEAVDNLVTTLADVAGWRLTVEAADTDGDGRALAADVGSAVGLAVANAISSSIAGDGAGVSGKVTACVARGEGLFTWDVRVSDEYVDESFASEHLERLFGSFARAASFAGLRLHVSAAGVLPAADVAEDAARAVGLALREALQPVAS